MRLCDESLYHTVWLVSSLTGLDWLVSVRANNIIFMNSLVKFNPVQRKATIQSPFTYIKYSLRWRITIIYICSLCLTSVLLDRPASARSITAPAFVLSQEKTVLNSVLRLQGLFLSYQQSFKPMLKPVSCNGPLCLASLFYIQKSVQGFEHTTFWFWIFGPNH